MHVTVRLEWKKNSERTQKVCEDIMPKIFPKLVKNINLKSKNFSKTQEG